MRTNQPELVRDFGKMTVERVLEIKDKIAESLETNKINMYELTENIKSLENISMTIDDLKATKIGLLINDVRKVVDDKCIQRYCKQLLKKWKNIISESSESLPCATTSSSMNLIQNNDIEAGSDNNGFSSLQQPEKRPNNNLKMSSINNISVDTHPKKEIKLEKDLNDPVRIACFRMIYKAILRDSDDSNKSLEAIARSLEQELFTLHHDRNKYKNAVRSKSFNLKDTSNSLRDKVVNGEITPKQLSTMTSEEMASDELKQIRKEIHKEAVNEHSLAVAEGIHADYFKCGRCGKNNCSYTQAQTRSSDEPMTTFVVCMDCGHRWKFC